MSSILEINGLCKNYRTNFENLQILNGLELSVPQGQKCVIVGKSGSGKSTLLNIIAGLDSADEGSVVVNGHNVLKMKERQLSNLRKNDIGLIFQFHYLLKDFTALENVYLPLYMTGVSKKESVSRARELLAEVGLEDRMTHLPSQLSGGERQRVAVARSLISNPKIVLADEPTGNLDPANAEIIGDLLFSLSKNHGTTLVLVTHDMKLASLGDVRYFMNGGKLSEEM